MDRRVAGRNESAKERVRRIGLTQELGMILAGHEKRVILEFDHLDQFPVRRCSAENESCLFVLWAVAVVELVSVAMAFVDQECAVKMRRFSSDGELAGLGA